MTFDDALATLHDWIGRQVQVTVRPVGFPVASFFGELGIRAEPIDNPENHIYWFTFGRTAFFWMIQSNTESVRMAGSVMEVELKGGITLDIVCMDTAA